MRWSTTKPRNKRAPSETSDQPAHPVLSDQYFKCSFSTVGLTERLQVEKEDCFAAPIVYFVGFILLRTEDMEDGHF